MKIVTFTWFNVTNEPIHIDKPIVCVTENDKLVVFKHTKTWLNGDTKHPFSGFKRLVDKYNIKYWAYQENLIP